MHDSGGEAKELGLIEDDSPRFRDANAAIAFLRSPEMEFVFEKRFIADCRRKRTGSHQDTFGDSLL